MEPVPRSMDAKAFSSLENEFKKHPQLEELTVKMKEILAQNCEVVPQLRAKVFDKMKSEDLRRNPTLIKAVEKFLEKYPEAASTVRLGKVDIHKILIEAKSRSWDFLVSDLSLEHDAETGDVDVEIEQALKEFFESGRTKITPQNVWKMLYYAHRTETEGLEEACTDFILKNNQLENLFFEKNAMEQLKSLVAMGKRFRFPVYQLMIKYAIPVNQMPPSLQEIHALLERTPGLVQINPDTGGSYFRLSNPDQLEALKELSKKMHIDLIDLSSVNCYVSAFAQNRGLSLFRGILELSSVSAINLTDTNVSDFYIIRLLENNQIAKMDASGNYFGMEVDLSDLKKNTGLKELILHSSNIKDVGTAHIANALPYNLSLRLLDLSENGITEQGAIALAKAIKENQGLRELHMEDNPIGRSGRAALEEAQKVNGKVRIFF